MTRGANFGKEKRPFDSAQDEQAAALATVAPRLNLFDAPERLPG
jgi:hypothetical protein